MIHEIETFDLRKMYDRLREGRDPNRNPFSDDLALVNSILFRPFKNPQRRKEALSDWLQHPGSQPCIFGRIAAAKGQLHFCILTDQDLQRSDQYLSGLIAKDLLAWKKRSARPTKEFSSPAHGFVLVVASERVALAAPDDRLEEFSLKVLDLWGCSYTEREPGRVYWETLYLRQPSDSDYVRFTFSVDFFAAQGDGEWWHDHRFPGGIAFTANSAGHMSRFKEWYGSAKEQNAWLLRTAMKTIDSAAETKQGKVTWLKSLSSDNQRPVDDSLQSPLKSSEFPGKDWTRYGGWLHTDLSVRPEFFQKSPDMSRSFNQDFAYLYDTKNEDHSRFIAGEKVSFDEVVQQIGDPAEFIEVEAPQIKEGESQSEDAETEELLRRCREWRLTPDDIRDLE